MLVSLPVLLFLSGGQWSGSLALGPRVHCQPCDEKAASVCLAPPAGCQLVKEPGCGCCLTCALEEGQNCGVYTEVCAAGLKCLPKPQEEKPLHALLHGRGVCSPAKSHQSPVPTPERVSPKSEESPASEGTEDGYITKPALKKHIRLSNQKVEALKRDQKKRLRVSKIISSSENTAHDRHQTSYKHDSELGPCRRQMEVVLQSLNKAVYLSPDEVYIPNCDRKGLYKRKQCKPSKGKRRGLCWCVDKYGFKLPDSDFTHHDFQCQTLETD
ncbi:insulin-like growth factor-binding protein 5 isoform X3 [Hypanus sabinus]|uniref:insulin-like growth factor-binding protein 5 isoform X3 n=1 Tax=Hypanus sabinus TaxID=79690 RepID=UPI0028C40114|nr:insulin-like growth factor-binding protein 5 isoform X3 [Hypanus sabinus]